jgi:RNA polymerase sigma-70 factor (ECF subfamily)
MKTTHKTTEPQSPPESEVEKHGGCFPTTQWGLFDQIQSPQTVTRTDILNRLVKLYWRPLYAYIRSKGYAEHEAEDMVQSFLLSCIESNFFVKAKQSRGRFRTFLRKSCDNYLKNCRRNEHAKKRCPTAGFVSLDELASPGDDKRAFEPMDKETPESAFDRAWAQNLLGTMLELFRRECEETGKTIHYQIFELRIVKPSLENSALPSLKELSVRFGQDEKKLANYLLTARRAFQRLLWNQIGTYALSPEDVMAEMGDLARLLSSSPG